MHNRHHIAPVHQESVFVAEIVNCSFAGDVGMGMVTEIIAEVRNLIPVHGGFAGRRKISQYPAVPAENIIHIPHEIVVVAIDPVVVIVPALIGTEFFIGPAGKRLLAIETKPFFFVDAHGLRKKMQTNINFKLNRQFLTSAYPKKQIQLIDNKKYKLTTKAVKNSHWKKKRPPTMSGAKLKTMA
jgi:hypothetical protein